MPIPKKLFAVLDLPLLRALLDDAGLKVVDIGGRGAAFYPVLTLAPFTQYFVSEPDPEEARRLREDLPHRAAWRALVVMADAIAPNAGVADLHVTIEPGMSSLLEPDPRVTGQFCLASKFRVVSVARVPTRPLDAAAERYGFADADFLKLDTQGTELDILRSGPRLVGESLLGVHTEACFHPFYKHQPVFADVDRHLREQGFVLLSLNRTALRRAAYRKTLYSRRVVAWAHCLYLRPAECVVVAGGDDARRRMTRLLALAVAFQHFDIAFEIAALAERARVLADGDGHRLAGEIERAATLSTRHMMQKAERVSLAASVMASSFRDTQQLE